MGFLLLGIDSWSAKGRSSCLTRCATWFERRRGGGVKLRVEVPVRIMRRESGKEPGFDGRNTVGC